MSSAIQNHPEPITVLKFSEAREVIVEHEELDKIFSHPGIQDRKVVILSLIGAFRGGKSFFLDYSLRFLYAHFPSINNPDQTVNFIFKKNENWMGSPDEPLKGFSWQSGYERDTTGIIMWSDVFLHTMDRTGEKVAIFVMDTQGLFDNDSTSASNSKIFALGTLVSSISVLNLMNRIQEDQLEYLQFATEFTQFAVRENERVDGKPFQNLMFLIRDWINEEDFEYGMVGGQKYLNVVLQSRQDENRALRSVRETISNSFEEVNCCLLPHPGKVVASRREYDGSWSKMDEDFMQELKKLVEYLLHPENMILKKITSKDVTVNEMKEYSQAYFRLFESNEIPRTSSIYELTVKSYMSNVMEKCINDYKLTVFRNKDLIIEKGHKTVHEKCKERALKLYDIEKKMGTIEYERDCKSMLSDKIDKIFKDYEKQSKYERDQQQAALNQEKEQKEEAERAKEMAETKLEELEEKNRAKQITLNEYIQQKIILEDRLKSEHEKLLEIEKKLIEEKEFTDNLYKAAIIGTAAVLIGKVIASVGAAGEAVGDAVDKAVSNAVDKAVSNVVEETIVDAVEETAGTLLEETVPSSISGIVPSLLAGAGVVILLGIVKMLKND